ncbi:MAG: NTP transferase domain-containing protein [Candidatus Poseidoniales archaeon]
MSVVAVILAGGTSRRMGEDKASMYGGVERLQACLLEAGVERSVVLCGREERKHLFEGEVLADPPHISGLHRIIAWVRERLESTVLLIPCDAFLLTSEAVSALMTSASNGGVPLDEQGRRQPLFAYLPATALLDENAENVSSMLDALPSVNLPQHASAFTNFNRPDDLEHPRLRDRLA